MRFSDPPAEQPKQNVWRNSVSDRLEPGLGRGDLLELMGRVLWLDALALCTVSEGWVEVLPSTGSNRVVTPLRLRSWSTLSAMLSFANAVAKGTGHGLPTARSAAHAYGRSIGADVLGVAGLRRTGSTERDAAMRVLAVHGFEPVHRGRQGIVLRNGPFSTLSAHRATRRQSACRGGRRRGLA